MRARAHSGLRLSSLEGLITKRVILCEVPDPGQRGFVGGSMGDDAAILSGVESETAAASFYSTAHGTGRVMSRTEARGRFVKDPETGKRTRQPGRVRHDEMEAGCGRRPRRGAAGVSPPAGTPAR
jgi:RNA-splicing ligase RtcB